MNYSPLLLLLTVTLTLVTVTSGTAAEKNYALDLEEAGRKLSSLTTDVSGGDLRGQVFQYIAQTGQGKKYFVHLLQLTHEILNDKEVKKMLDFLTANGIDPNNVFKITVPPTIVESLQGGDDDDFDDYDDSDDKKEDVSLSNLEKLIPLETILPVVIDLLENNAAIKKIYEMLSDPSVLFSVYSNVISKYDDFFKKVSKDTKDLPIKRVKEGVMKMVGGRGDPARGFREGMGVVLGCGGGSGFKNACEILKGKKKEEL